MTRNTMSCDRFDELLPDYLEGTLDAGTRTEVDAHLTSCQRCAAIVADVKAIASAAADLPELAPSRELWSGISERIAAPVISLPSEREGRTVRYSRVRVFAAAAALVVMTATLTAIGTRWFMQQAQTQQIASNPTPPLYPGNPEHATPRSDTASASTKSAPVAAEAPVSTQSAPAQQRTRLADEPVRQPAPRDGSLVGRRAAVERAYDREVNQLQQLLNERRGELDPNTVQVIERNLRVIDDAIRQSREALQRDPASRFLNDQLNNALDKKIELLRSAAMLPSST